MDEKLLIAVIKKHPAIYDRNDLKDAVKRKNAWDGVSKTLNVSVPDCVRLWRNIRERYGKELKKFRATSSLREPRWGLFQYLSFLKPHIRARRNAQLMDKIDECLLIGMVKRYPELYDKDSSSFRNSAKRETAWDEIASAFSVSVEDCMRVWKNIRERYAKELKRLVITQTDRSRWVLFESLSFLQPHIKARSKSLYTTDSPWDSTNIIINHDVVNKVEKFEDVYIETHEIPEQEEAVELTDTPGSSPNHSFRTESPTMPEFTHPPAKRLKINYTNEHSTTEGINNRLTSDMVFGNYVGQYLSEICDTRTKNKLKLSIMEILHGGN